MARIHIEAWDLGPGLDHLALDCRGINELSPEQRVAVLEGFQTILAIALRNDECAPAARAVRAVRAEPKPAATTFGCASCLFISGDGRELADHVKVTHDRVVTPGELVPLHAAQREARLGSAGVN